MTTTIKVTDERQGRSFRTGVNGRMFDIPLNTEVKVDDALVDHLKGMGVAFEEVDGPRASSSKEGSGDELAPIGPHDVMFPGTETKGKTLTGGDQPGDVTEGGVHYSGTGNFPGSSITDDAEVSDIRVAAERMSKADDPVAKKMGEGEQGTETPDTQGVEPTHKDTTTDKPKKAKAKK